MNVAAPARVRAGRRRLGRLAIGLAVAVVLLALLGSWLLQPQRASAFALKRLGAALGLQITAAGQASYRLRGTPQLVLRDVVARRPGDATDLLRADRVFVAVPWTTIRARGAELVAQRIELDTPVLDLPALQRWQATRPQGETRIPTLTDGLRIVRGRVVGNGWSIEGIEADLPSLAPGQPLRMQLQGRYVSPPVQLPFDLAVALTRPDNDAGAAAFGTATLQGEGWKLPARIQLSGPLHVGEGGIAMMPARIGMSARYVSTDSSVPFVLGAAGPLRLDTGVWTLAPASLVLHGDGLVPDAAARGAIAFGTRLVLRVDGVIAAWPDAWPALPPPLSQSSSPLSFAIDYLGTSDGSDPVGLSLRRDHTTFDARFRLPSVLQWIDAGASGSPLPPLDGRLQTPKLEIAGAQLEGVEVEFDDEGIVPAESVPSKNAPAQTAADKPAP